MKPKRCTAQYPFTGTFQNGARCTLEVRHAGNHTIIPPSGMDYAPDDELERKPATRDYRPSWRRAEEIEALAEKVFIGYIVALGPEKTSPSDECLASWSFTATEAWIAERDRRREKS